MTQPNTRAWFQTTSWSLVLGSQTSQIDLERLLALYWGPVYAYIRRSGRDPADAADLTQDFLSQVALERDLIGKARPERGRFRTFVQSALRNFLIDQHRRATSTRRAPANGCVPRDPQLLAEAEPAGTSSPDDAFARLWATRVLTTTLERLEADCRENGLSRQWEAFDAAVVAPAVRQTPVCPMAELAAKVGAQGPDQVSNMLQTVKRRFRRTLREVVAETVSDAADIDDELSSLKQILA